MINATRELKPKTVQTYHKTMPFYFRYLNQVPEYLCLAPAYDKKKKNPKKMREAWRLMMFHKQLEFSYNKNNFKCIVKSKIASIYIG